MKRARFPIALLMAAVAAVAINLAVWRSFDLTISNGGGLSSFFFACGAVPMASLLILIALIAMQRLLRGGLVSPFVVGFEAVGWAAVFMFMTCYSVAPWALLNYAELIGAHTRPVFERYLADTPSWVGFYIELVGVIICSPPQLLIALLGGWLTRKLGLTVRFERQRKEERAVPPINSTSDAGTTAQPVLEWQVSN